MKQLPLPAAWVLAAGLTLGVLGDALMRVSGEPGLNVFLWAACVAGATLLLYRRGGQAMSAESATALAIGVLFTGGLAWRDSPALKLLALGCAAVAFALPALRAGAAWIRSSGVAEYVAAVAGAGAHGVFGAALVLADVDWHPARAGERGPWTRAAAVARGVALATPFILVFGALLMAADAVFADAVTAMVRIDPEEFASHALLIGFFTWIATGYLRGVLTGTRVEALMPTGERPKLGITEIATVVALLDLLFLAFVVVQFRYLFGGSGLVEVTPGLTYAEYARRGFFELVTVTVLVLPLLLAADWLLRRERARDEIVFRALTAIQIVLVLAVTASALQRMRVYQEAYGLTEQRVYATALLILIAVVLVWFTVTVLRGRRGPFAFGALAAGFATVAALYAANPDAIIARTNIARMNDADTSIARTDVARVQAGAAARTPLDVSYALSLSADAVPVLLTALPTLPEETQCAIARRMLDRWGPDTETFLRSWSWSAARARSAVGSNEASLRMLAGADRQC